MEDLRDLLFCLCRAQGVSGLEKAAAQAARKALEPFGNVDVDVLGNVVMQFGNQEADTQILLNAHIDQIGMLVTSVDEEGFLHVAPCGGVDRRVLPGSPVQVWGKEVLTGIVCCLPPHLVEGGEDKISPVDKMAVDIGLCREEAMQLVEPGDRIIVFAEPRSLLNTRVTGSALDDRAGAAAVIRCVQLLSREELSCGVTVLLSTREETGGQGAKTGTFSVDPDQAICVDVSFASQPGVPAHKSGKLGEGPMIGMAPSLDSEMAYTMKQIAEEKGIPYQLEIMGGTTGTDADGIGITKGGVRCALLSIPQRNMHTPCEIVDIEDIENTARLMAEYVKGVR